MVDLCRGPHVPNTGVLKEMAAGALTSAFWRGDAAKASLQVGQVMLPQRFTCSWRVSPETVCQPHDTFLV